MPLAYFAAPARPTSELWRTAIGLVVIVVSAFALGQVYYTGVYAVLPSSVTAALHDGQSAAAMLVLLMSFTCFGLATALGVGFVHRRPARSLFGPLPDALVQGWRVLKMLVLLTVVIALLPPWGYGEPLSQAVELGAWLSLLPLALLAVFVQVTAEEVLFRGYLQQQLAARFASPMAWMLVPSALFAAGHYAPQEAGDNAWVLVMWSGVFGLLMADLTARSGTLGPAIAMHLLNNVLAIVIVSVPDSLSGLALYHLPFGLKDTEAVAAWLPVDFLSMFVYYLAARLALRV